MNSRPVSCSSPTPCGTVHILPGKPHACSPPWLHTRRRLACSLNHASAPTEGAGTATHIPTMVSATDRLLSAYAGRIATGVLVSISIAIGCDITPWMHNLLSYSHKHPVPSGSKCDFGVVLGYALHRNGSCTRPLQSRVEIGVKFFEQGTVERLIFSGAHPGDALRNVTEANAMMAYALTLVPAPPPVGRWLLEEHSTSTRTNAVYSLHIIQQHHQQHSRGYSSIVLVTNPFHQLRSYFTFSKAAIEAGMDVQLYVANAPFVGHHGYGNLVLDGLMDQWDFWRELAAIAWYKMRGYM